MSFSYKPHVHSVQATCTDCTSIMYTLYKPHVQNEKMSSLEGIDSEWFRLMGPKPREVRHMLYS